MQLIRSQTYPFARSTPGAGTAGQAGVCLRVEGCLQSLGRYSRAWWTYGQMDPTSQRRRATGLDGRQPMTAQGDRRHCYTAKTHEEEQKSNVYFKLRLLSTDSQSSAFQWVSKSKATSAAVWNMKSGCVCVCEREQQLAVSLSGEMAVAARHTNQLWLEMMCVFWPEEGKRSRLVCRRQPWRELTATV